MHLWWPSSPTPLLPHVFFFFHHFRGFSSPLWRVAGQRQKKLRKEDQRPPGHNKVTTTYAQRSRKNHLKHAWKQQPSLATEVCMTMSRLVPHKKFAPPPSQNQIGRRQPRFLRGEVRQMLSDTSCFFLSFFFGSRRHSVTPVRTPTAATGAMASSMVCVTNHNHKQQSDTLRRGHILLQTQNQNEVRLAEQGPLAPLQCPCTRCARLRGAGQNRRETRDCCCSRLT